MSFLEKFRKGAQKAGIQATTFVQNSSVKVASESKQFMQGFSLPGEAEKAANILESFLGVYTSASLTEGTDCRRLSTFALISL
jgi:hypothetical protein